MTHTGERWTSCFPLKRVRAVLLIALASLWHGCMPSGPSRGGSTESAEAVKQYGYGPKRSPHVRYQPDVVLIESGANAVRGVSDDGLTWTIDASAPGASDLKVGKIMFATSRAVGRVVGVEQRGKDLAVTVVPVGFTEVIRDAKLDFNIKLPPDGFASYQSTPPSGVSVIRLAEFGSGRPQPAFWRTSTDGARLQKAGLKFSAKATIGDWEVEPYVKSTGRSWSQPGPNLDPYPEAPLPTDKNGLELREAEKVVAFGLKVQKKLTSGDFGPEADSSGANGTKSSGGAIKYGLKFGGDVRLIGTDIRVYGHLSVSDGKIDEPVTFLLDGLDALQIGLLGGTENGATDNEKIRVEIPAEMAFNVGTISVVGGLPPVPLAVHLKLKFIVETAFSGMNSTLWGKGSYRLSGPIGVQNGSLVTPQFSVEKPMIEDIHGIPVGISGLVFAAEFRWLLGLGTEAAMFGPYAKIVVSVGTSRGSFLGFMLGGPLSDPLHPKIDCRGVTIKGDVGAGIGLVINKNWSKLLDKYHIKTDSELGEMSATFVNESVVQPQSALCHGGPS